jgi:alkanesulfonate monooxygenase SsuD/methylene tetrahydromethanopterin reductase-like flavin-dependent oxidoreductase (luciferase family)
MKFGITVDNPATVINDAREAEEMGFDFLGCGEHLFFHGPTPNAFSAVSAAYHQDFAPLADRYLLIGTPESVAARLDEFAGAGVESVLLQIAAGNRKDRRRIIESIAHLKQMCSASRDSTDDDGSGN